MKRAIKKPMKTKRSTDFNERLIKHFDEYQVDYGIGTEVVALGVLLAKFFLSLKNIH